MGHYRTCRINRIVGGCRRGGGRVGHYRTCRINRIVGGCRRGGGRGGHYRTCRINRIVGGCRRGGGRGGHYRTCRINRIVGGCRRGGHYRTCRINRIVGGCRGWQNTPADLPCQNLKMCPSSVFGDRFPGMFYAFPQTHFQVLTCRLDQKTLEFGTKPYRTVPLYHAGSYTWYAKHEINHKKNSPSKGRRDCS